MARFIILLQTLLILASGIVLHKDDDKDKKEGDENKSQWVEF